MSSSWPAARWPRRVRLFLLLSLLVALAVLPLAGFAVAQLYGQWVDGQRRSERQLELEPSRLQDASGQAVNEPSALARPPVPAATRPES